MFWRKNNSAVQERETVRRAREQFQSGDHQAALTTLTQAFIEQPDDRAAYGLGAELLTAMDAPEEAALFRQAQESEPLQAMFDLGMHFAEAEHGPLTEAFLGKVFELTRHPVAAFKLAEAKRLNFQLEAAAELLAQAEQPLPYWAQVELARIELLLGRPDAARQLQHEFSLLSAAEQQEYGDITRRVRDTLSRYESVPMPQPIVRDWHYIQYGAAILSFMGEHDDQDAFQVAGGRYVYQSGGEEEVLRILHTLAAFLKEMGPVPAAVWACPDRDSEIIGRVIAQILQVPFLTGARPQEDVLVVAADSRSLLQSEQDVQELTTVHTGQVTFAFNVNWVQAAGVTPDIAGLLSQMYVFPWSGGQMRLNTENPDDPKVVQSEADERPATEIAASLLTLNAPTDLGFENNLAFYRPVREYLTINQTGAPRWPFSRESPVPGSYFNFSGMSVPESEEGS